MILIIKDQGLSIIFNKLFGWTMERTAKNGDYRRYYEMVLSTNSSVEVKQDAINSIVKLAITDDSHFSFLLNQINWFSTCNKPLIPLLNKIIRLYRSTSKSASKMIYNLLADGLTIQHINISLVDVIANSLSNTQDRTCFSCLKDNYPHKICPLQAHLNYQNSLLLLCKKVPTERIQFFEIILENLTYFDTEMILGEAFTHQFIPEDTKILELTDQCEQLQEKYDVLLANFLKFIASYSSEQQTVIMKELFIIFQKIIMLVDNTKMIQIILFYLAEQSPQLSQSFIHLLMVSLSENYSSQGSKRKFLAALQYLTSYVCRSYVTPTTKNMLKKIVQILVNMLERRLSGIQQTNYNDINIKQFREQNYEHLELLQSIMVIVAEFPELKSPKSALQEKLTALLLESHHKLYFKIYLKPEILSIHKIEHKQHPKDLSIGFCNKFIPIFLPATQKMVKMKMKLSGKRSRKDNESSQPQKKRSYCINGGQSPITIGQTELETK